MDMHNQGMQCTRFPPSALSESTMHDQNTTPTHTHVCCFTQGPTFTDFKMMDIPIFIGGKLADYDKQTFTIDCGKFGCLYNSS